MILLVSGATRTVDRHPQLGRLMTPRGGNSIESAGSDGRPWAADNDAFLAWDEGRFVAMLARIAAADLTRFLWVACPDVVGDAPATLARWRGWQPRIAALGLPLAFVGQDGATPGCVPWGEAACLFVGGSTAWKLSGDARALCAEAKARGKWLHVGRVNSRRRIRYAAEVGADSVDGSGWSKWPDARLPKGLAWAKQSREQGLLFAPSGKEQPR